MASASELIRQIAQCPYEDVRWTIVDTLNDIPYAEELDLHVDGKGSLEVLAQVETHFVVPRIHGICERQLLEVARGEKSDFLNHASEGAGCESATRETKNTDMVSGTI